MIARILTSTLLTMGLSVAAASGAAVGTSQDLMVVLRSTAPTQEAQASADFPFVGQLQFEFVFDHDGKASPASRQDLDALKLPIAQAQSLALQNIKRSYGEAKIERANGDILMLRSRSTDYASSFMLDRALWLELLKQAPQGFVAAVPRRGALLFAPADEYKAVEHLRKAVQDMYETGDGKQISTALYVFKGERWTVFQPSP